MTRMTTVFVLAFTLAACAKSDEGQAEENPCDAYVEALCECNEASCDEFWAQYQNADVDDKDTCAALLDDAKSGDDPACETGDSGSGRWDTGT
jgi:hypothetical protein